MASTVNTAFAEFLKTSVRLDPDQTAKAQSSRDNLNKIVVTNGFVKKTQKTPQTELVKAQKYKKDYERRHQHE